jgi:hypothetical protein
MPGKVKYLTVWKKQADGSWKIYRDISNSQPTLDQRVIEPEKEHGTA